MTREPAGGPHTGAPTAADAFDMLHGRCAAALARQTFLLCGRPRLARRAVARAFAVAWQRWPEVAVDPDPAGWVRAAAHRYALAPWRNLRPLQALHVRRAMRHVPPRDRPLLAALLRLPPSYRAAVLLCDGLALSFPDTAAELEASSAATAGRLRHARAALTAQLPGPPEAPEDPENPEDPEDAAALTASALRQLAAPLPVTLPPARRVRRRSSARSRLSASAALGLTAAVAAACVAFGGSAGDQAPSGPARDAPAATLAPDRQPDRPAPLL